MTNPIYAVGDIHGYKSRLDEALEKIDRDGGRDARVVFLGDYCDRGPDTRGVIDTFLRGIIDGRDWIFLKGNHDRLFEWFLRDGETKDPNIQSGILWLNERMGGEKTLAAYMDLPCFLNEKGGGVQTLTSYGLEPMPSDLLKDTIAAANAAVPREHKEFIANLPLSHMENGIFFCHAGIRPGVPFGEQVEEDLIWIRDGWLDNTDDHGALVVHGHTLLDYPKHYGNRVNLDGGTAWGAPLYPAVFEGGKSWLLTDAGREPLVPNL